MISGPDVSFAPDDKFVTRQFAQPAGATRVKLVGADSDFGSQPEFLPVVESRAGVDHHRGTVHAGDELARGRRIVRDDRVGVVRTVAVDVLDRFVRRRDDLRRNDRAEKFRAVIFVRRGPSGGDEFARPFVSADFDLAGGEFHSDARQEFGGDIRVDQQRFAGVADSHSLALRINRDPFGHRQIGRAVDIDVAVAREMFDHRLAAETQFIVRAGNIRHHAGERWFGQQFSKFGWCQRS